MKITASKNFVVLTDIKVEQTPTGLIIPEQDEKNKPELGIVDQIGTGEKPFDFKIGDKVIFRKYTESPIRIYGVRYNFIKFEDLVGKVEE